MSSPLKHYTLVKTFTSNSPFASGNVFESPWATHDLMEAQAEAANPGYGVSSAEIREEECSCAIPR